MEPINVISGAVSVLDRSDVDTDQIIPKQFLKRVERTGFGEFLFYDWAKEPGWDLPANPVLVAGASAPRGGWGARAAPGPPGRGCAGGGAAPVARTPLPPPPRGGGGAGV